MSQPTARRTLRRLAAIAGATLLAATGALALAAPAQAGELVQLDGPAGPLPVGVPYTVAVAVAPDATADIRFRVDGAPAAITNVQTPDDGWGCEAAGEFVNCWEMSTRPRAGTFVVTVLPSAEGVATLAAYVYSPWDYEVLVETDHLDTLIGAPAFQFSGFEAPVRNAPVVNEMNAGRSVPVKFSLGGDRGLDILAGGAPTSTATACDGGAIDPIVETTTSRSGLHYDAATDAYTYVWKTDKAWAGTCRTLQLHLSDGTTHTAEFRFK